MKRIFALILGFTVSLQCVGYAAELDSTINSEAIPDEAATASFNEVSQETEDVVLSEDTVNEAAEEMESEIGISEAEIAEESVLTATESVEALQLFGTETDAEKSITNPKTMFYFNDYNTAGQYDFLSTYNINAVKGYNTEKGSVLSLSALSGGVYGDAVYEIGSITDVWDGATRDTSWYDAMDTTFEISSAAALAGLSKLVQDGITFEGKTLTLKCNVDLNNKEWTPIGGSSYKFKGTFDGDGNEIKNLKIAKSYGGGYVGVFGYIEGKLSNLGVNGAEVQVTSTSTGKLTMAALAAQLTGTIESCYAKNTSLRLLRSDDKEATRVLDLIAPVVASLGKGSTMNSCYSTNLYIYSSWGALTGGIFSLSFGESSAKNTINNCYTGGSCVVETNPKTGNAVRYYPMGAKNTSANTSGSKNICGHTTTLFKGDKATYGNVYSELAPNTATEETLKNSVSDLGALYEADTYYSNDGFPVLQSQRTPIDDAMNIAFDVMVPIGSDAELVLYAGKEEAGTLKLGSIAAGAWSSLELILKEGVYTPIVNGVSQGSNNLTSQNHTVSAFAFRVYGNDILLDNLMIYKDNQELLGAKLDALETLVVSQMQEYPKLSENLSLVSEFEGCQVKWQSSNPSVLSDTGEILAQKNCSIPVTMTAEVKLPRPHEDYDAATAEIAFPIQIAPAEGADAAAVVDDILEYLLAGSNITEEVWHKISKNLKTLPAAWDGASITWESSDASVMETNGTVHILESENKEVTLTAVVILDGVRQSKELNFTVLSANTMLTEAMNAITYTDLTDEEWQNLTKDLTLPDTGLYGTKIIWSSDCPQLVTDKGYVMEIVDDTYVTMTAEFEILGYTQIKTFPFVAKLSASKKIETDMSGITLPTETDTDFSVPVQGETYESVISWSCNSPYVTINSGKVQITRPEHETGNVEVVLVAKFENGGTEISKEYTVTVLCLPTDEILLQNELDALTFADISYEKDLSAIKNDLHLKTSFPYDIQYTWTSTEPEVVTMDGKVIRPAIGEADVPVTLTLTIERGGVIKSKPFPFKVKAYGSTEEVLEQASALLTFRTLSQEPINLISKNLFLPKSWKYGTEITW
ncbi:MAG: immunoglobulin-like domain-containing protein, partial [Clostridia bacterium]|nr:immunoglobulin-like domain-containing protein [Clostridia bacterium]